MSLYVRIFLETLIQLFNNFQYHTQIDLRYRQGCQQSAASNAACQRLRSASSLDFIVPQTRTKIADRAFSVAGPTVWNSLPESVRLAEHIC